jgi:hypothetical protein
LSRKLLAFALNRSPQLSDEGTLDKMNSRLAANGYKIDVLVETIVTSPQFLNKRVAAQTTSSVKTSPVAQKKTNKEQGE